MTHKYPTLGDRVTFIRANQDGHTFTGEGVVIALFLNPDKRPMAQVKATDNQVWNVDLITINYTPETLEAYKSLVTEVQAMTDEGNNLVKSTIDDYNGRVGAAYAAVLGEPLDIPEYEDDETDPAEQAAS